MKRKYQALQAVKGAGTASQLNFTKKQLRSRFPRCRRLHFSPLILFSAPAEGVASYFTQKSAISCNSSVASVNESRRASVASHYGKNSRNFVNVELSENVSENSCVESCSGVVMIVAHGNRDLKLKSENVEEEVEGEESTKSEVSSVSRHLCTDNASGANARKLKEFERSVGITQNEVAFEIPSGFSPEITNSDAVKVQSNDNSVLNRSVLLNSNSIETTVKISENKSCELLRSDAINKIPELAQLDMDLACSEQFSNGDVLDDGEEEHNSSSDIYQVVSDLELESSDYTSSLWSYASGSQFSEKSIGDEGCSPTFQLLNQFKQQFCRSTFVSSSACNACDENYSQGISILGLEDEDEESYKVIRKRERRQVYLRDYAEEYCSTTDYGNLVIQQRQHMVHWIVEQATDKEFQKETMFLGVSLLDRFLSNGYFRNMRNFQIAGIACLTLATRLEENQPHNCIRRKTFNVGSTTYSRCEVVAMEWLVQEVLHFECFLPTLYNFLWFYLKAARANEKMEKTAKYLAILALLGHQQLCYWPSTVAAGIVIIASIAANQDVSCNLITAVHARQKDKDLPECIKKLEWLVKYL